MLTLSDESNLKITTGMKLPIPYVEKATVFNDNIQLKIGVYLVVPAEQSVEDSVAPLKDLYFYIGQIFDGKPSNFFTVTYTENELELGTQRMLDLMTGQGVMNLLVDVTNSDLSLDVFEGSE